MRNECDRAFMLIKHEAVQRNLVGEILKRIEKKGLKIIGLKMLQLTENDVKKLYKNCIQLPFFDEMKQYNAGCPLIAVVVEGENGNKCANEVCGKIGMVGSVRGDFALCNARNVLHCSDIEQTDREIELFFLKEEIFEYQKSLERWMR